MAQFGDALVGAADVGGDLVLAGRSAAEAAMGSVDGAVDLATVFVSGGDPVAAAEAALAASEALQSTPTSVVIGCTAAGVIGGGRGVEQAPAVSVWAASLPGAHLRSFHLEVIRLPEGMAVVGTPEREPTDLVGVLFADPFSFPAEGFVERSATTLQGLPLVGGLAMGMQGAGSTRLLIDGRIVDRGAVGVIIGGPLAVRAVVSQGCRPIGPTMTVTESSGNVVAGLAGTPALQKLEQITVALDEDDRELVASGLQFGIAMNEYADDHESGDFLIRPVLGAEPDGRGVVVGEMVEVGTTARFHVRDPAAAAADLDRVLTQFRDDPLLGGVGGALLVSCNGRGQYMFGHADHDVQVARRLLGTPAVGGLFAGGEIGPVAGVNHLHGFTASLLVFGSEP